MRAQRVSLILAAVFISMAASSSMDAQCVTINYTEGQTISDFSQLGGTISTNIKCGVTRIQVAITRSGEDAAWNWINDRWIPTPGTWAVATIKVLDTGTVWDIRIPYTKPAGGLLPDAKYDIEVIATNSKGGIVASFTRHVVVSH